MSGSHHGATDRVLKAAAWAYLLPRAGIGILILAMFGFGAFLVLLRAAIVFLQRLGA